VQIVFDSGHTSESYVSEQGWHDASIEQCPQCRRAIRRHGTYERKCPAGLRIARFYCRACHLTVSLLPDFLAAGYSDTLAVFETAVDAVASTSTFDEAAARARPDIELQGARRWYRRRQQRRALLVLLKATAQGVAPEAIDAFALRTSHPHLIAQLPTPVGLSHRPIEHWRGHSPQQHTMGPDPP
jgi:transposase-like protein